MIKKWMKKLLKKLKGDIFLQRLIVVIILAIITFVLFKILGIE